MWFAGSALPMAAGGLLQHDSVVEGNVMANVSWAGGRAYALRPQASDVRSGQEQPAVLHRPGDEAARRALAWTLVQ
jgi:hypothetical protein